MSFLSSLFSAFVPAAHAFSLQDVGGGTFSAMWSGITGRFPLTGTGTGVIAVMMSRANTIILGGIATVGVGAIAYASLRLMSTGLSEEGAAEAKKIIKNAIVGVMLAVLADGIVLWFLNLYTQIGNI